MTVQSRTLLLLAGLALHLAAGCITVEKPAPVTQPDKKPPVAQATGTPGSSGFAVMPSRPGEKVPTGPAARAPATDPPPAEPAGTTTSHRTTPKAEPEVPEPPDAALRPVRAEPAPLPVLPGPPVPDPPLLAAVRAYLENRPDQAIEHLKDLSKPNQELVLAVLPALVRGAQIDLARSDPQDVGALVDQLQGAADRLEDRAPLRIDKMLFCKQVRGFGRYDPWPDGQPYRPGQLAELYVEIRHLACEPAPGDGFLTRLVSSLEVRDANGRPVEQTDPADWRRTVTVARTERSVFSRSPLQDFYITYKIPVPAQPGVYTVTVEIRNPGGGNRAVRSKPVEFRVAGP
jgi:hypothetical protein